MRRTLGILAAVLGPVLAVAAGPGGPTLVPDPDYVPRAGDRAVLYSLGSEQIPRGLWCASTRPQWHEYIKGLFREGDAKPKAKAEGQARAATSALLHLAPRTQVELLASESVAVDTGDGEPPLNCTCWTIRVLSGPAQGKTLYTPDFQITRLVESRTAPGDARSGIAEASPRAAAAAAPARPPEPVAPPTPPEPAAKPLNVLPPSVAEVPALRASPPPDLPPRSEPPVPAPASRSDRAPVIEDATPLVAAPEPPARALVPAPSLLPPAAPSAATPVEAPPAVARPEPPRPAAPTDQPPASVAVPPRDRVPVAELRPPSSAPAPAASVPAPPTVVHLETVPSAAPADRQPVVAVPPREHAPVAEIPPPPPPPAASVPAPPTVVHLETVPSAAPANRQPVVASPPREHAPVAPVAAPAASVPAPPTVVHLETVPSAAPADRQPVVATPPRDRPSVAAVPPPSLTLPARVEPSKEVRRDVPANRPASTPAKVAARPSLATAPATPPAVVSSSAGVTNPAQPANRASATRVRPDLTASAISSSPRVSSPSRRPSPARAADAPVVIATSRPAPVPAPARTPAAAVDEPPAEALTPAGMLATARDLEQRQQRIDAIVQYRSVANAYPVSREAEYARQRITALTDALRIDAEETRAASIVRRARELEAEGEISMALAHYHQVIKVYPRTPSARSSAERIQMLGGVEAARRQAGSPTRPTH